MAQAKNAGEPFADASHRIPSAGRPEEAFAGPYKFKGILGAGGMGQVFLVHHRGWHVDLAVKAPRPEFFARVGGQEAFLREAETWVNLELHPHIAECYYVRTLEGIPHIFAEYVAGRSLADWIRQRRLYAGRPQQALQRILDIAVQFAWGLDAAHVQGLVHQDVKPANVLMTPDGVAKVTDFGLARARALAEGSLTLPTQAGQQSLLVSGRGMTPAYCSPEQAAGQLLSRKTDIWSWAVSVLEMFMGEVTWLSGVLAGEVLASYQAPHTPLLPTLPQAVANLLQRCLATKPEQRPASMAEVAPELITIYERECGERFPRQEPVLVQALADSLNNRAISLYDLGKHEEARAIWQKSTQADHLESCYNAGLAAWYSAQITDDTLITTFQLACDKQPEHPSIPLLQAHIHLSRGAVQDAVPLLNKAAHTPSEEQEARSLLEQVHAGAFPVTQQLGVLQEATSCRDMSLNTTGEIALCIGEGAEYTLQVWDTVTGCLWHTLAGHTGSVNAVCISGNGQLGLSASNDATVRVWDLVQGRCLRVFSEQDRQVTHVKMSLDGASALSRSTDGCMRLWDVERGQSVATFTVPDIHDLALSGNGTKAVTIDKVGAVQIWEQARVKSLSGPLGEYSTRARIALSADGNTLILSAPEGTLHVWNLQTNGQLRCVLRGHAGPVTSLSLSANGRFALSGGRDKIMRLWDVESGVCLFTWRDPAIQSLPPLLSLVEVVLSPDGRRALFTSFRTEIQIWQIAQERYIAPPRFSRLHSHHESADIRTQAQRWLTQAEAAYQQGRFALALDLLARVRSMPDYARSERVDALLTSLRQVCPRGNFRSAELVGTLSEGRPRRTQKNILNLLESQEMHWALALSSDGRTAITSREDQLLDVWDVRTQSSVMVMPGHRAPVSTISISADGTQALSGSHDTTICLWEITSGQAIRLFQGHQQPVYAVALSQNGQLALSGGADNTLRLWEVATGHCLRVLEGHTDWIYSVSISADGRLGLSGGRDGIPYLWDLTTGRFQRLVNADEKETLKAREEKKSLFAVTLSSDGQYALTGGSDDLVCVWDLVNGQVHSYKTQARGNVRDLWISSDQRLAISASDGGIDIWNVETKRCLQTLPGNPLGTRALALSNDHFLLLSYGYDQSLLQWSLDWELEAPC